MAADISQEWQGQLEELDSLLLLLLLLYYSLSIVNMSVRRHQSRVTFIVGRPSFSPFARSHALNDSIFLFTEQQTG